MQSRIQTHYEARARILKAMAHPTRLFILDVLAKNGGHCVCELTEMVGADTSTVSRHLRLLREAGLVSLHRQGASVYYEIRMPSMGKFLDGIESVIEMNAREQQELLI